MAKKSKKSKTVKKTIVPVKGSIKGREPLRMYSFPEYGISIRAIDLQSAKIELNKRLEGEK